MTLAAECGHPGHPGELPSDFFERLTRYMASDCELQRRLMAANSHGRIWNCGASIRSRFLHKCIMGHNPEACQLWMELDGPDKRDLLLAYSCGPPQSDFFAKMLVPRHSPCLSDCGSSVGDLEVRSDSS